MDQIGGLVQEPLVGVAAPLLLLRVLCLMNQLQSIASSSRSSNSGAESRSRVEQEMDCV